MQANEVLVLIQERLQEVPKNGGADEFAQALDDIAGIMMDNGFWRNGE